MINFTELMKQQESTLLDTPIDKQLSYTQIQVPLSCKHGCIPTCNWTPKSLCDCGENIEAAASLSSPQHSEKCAISLEFVAHFENLHKLKIIYYYSEG